MTDDPKIRQIGLARVLLDDIALARLSSQPLLIKTRRLARMAQAQEFVSWLGWELSGYTAQSELEIRYLEKTGRFIDKRTWTFYWQPLAELEQKVAGVQTELRNVQSGSGDGRSRRDAPQWKAAKGSGAAAILSLSPAMIAELSLTEEIGRIFAIRWRVVSMLQEFVGCVYCTLVFRRLVETIFEKHQAWADTLLHAGVGNALEEIPLIYRRLSAADREVLIHALERVWNCQPLAWRPRRKFPELSGDLEVVSEASPPEINSEEVLVQFNRVVRQLLRGTMSRTAARRSREDLLADIRDSARENLVYRPQKAIAPPIEKGARLI